MEIACEWIVLPGGRHEKGPFYVCVEDGVIASVSQEPSKRSDVLHLSTYLLVPGFIDLHTHGVGRSISVVLS